MKILPILRATYKHLRHCGAITDRHGKILEAQHAWDYFQDPRSVGILLPVIMDRGVLIRPEMHIVRGKGNGTNH